MSRTVILFLDRNGHAYQTVHLNGTTGAVAWVGGRMIPVERSEVASEIQLARISGSRVVRRVEVLA
jgi:hypothetical protein